MYLTESLIERLSILTVDVHSTCFVKGAILKNLKPTIRVIILLAMEL